MVPLGAVARTVLIWAGLFAVTAGAAEIKVLSTSAASTALRDVGPQFERSTGDKLVVGFANIAALKQRIAEGEAFGVTRIGAALAHTRLE